jgi:hypothetical protein
MSPLPVGFVPDGFVPDPPAAAEPVNVLAAGRRGGFDEGAPPSGIAQWFEEKLRPMLAQVAHPDTIGEIAHLLVPDAGLTATMRAGARAVGAARAAGGAAVRGTLQKTAALGDVVDPDVIGIFSPRAGKVVTVAQKAREAVQAAKAKAAARAAPPVSTPPPITAPAAVAPPRPTLVPKPAAQAGNALPDQKALNEAAIAARRAAYQAQQQGANAAATAPKIVAASGKMHFTGPELVAFRELRAKGLSLKDAEATVKAMKTTAKGLPTDAQMKAAIAARQYKR